MVVVGENTDKEKETSAGRRRVPGVNRVALLVFAVCLVVYLVVFGITLKFVNLPWGRADGDQQAYLIVTQSLLRDGDLHIEDEYADRLYMKAFYLPGPILTRSQLIPGANGRLVSPHAVLPSLVVLPGFAFAGYKGAAGTMILILALAAVFTFLIIKRFMNVRLAAAITLFFFLSYPIIAYSRFIYPEVMVMFLLALGTWLGLRIREGAGWPYFLAAGLVAGTMPWLHPKFIIISLCLAYLVAVCSWKKYKQWAVFVVPFVLCVIGLLFWTRYLYGPNIINGLAITRSGGMFGNDSGQGVAGLFVGRGWGLLPYALLYLIFFAGVAIPRRLKDLGKWWVFIPLTIVLYVLVVGSFRDWNGGFSPVPRYLIPLMPLLVLCCAVVIKEVKGRWPWVVMGVLGALQALFTVLALIDPAASYPLASYPLGLSLYPRFFGGNGFGHTIERVFPIFDFSRVTINNVLLLLAWIVFIATFTYLLRSAMRRKPEDLLDGGKSERRPSALPLLAPP